MNFTTTITAPNGRVLGRTVTEGNKKTLYSAAGAKLGWYDQRANKTFGANGGVVSSQGDVLMSLLRSC